MATAAPAWTSDSSRVHFVGDDGRQDTLCYLDLAAGIYRFTATSDDGLRVYVDGTLILNMWYDHGVKTISTERRRPHGRFSLHLRSYPGFPSRPEPDWRTWQC